MITNDKTDNKEYQNLSHHFACITELNYKIK